MDNDSLSFPMDQLLEFANSETGKKLMALVEKSSDEAFNSALAEAQTGDYTEIKEIIGKILRTPEAEEIIRNSEVGNE